MKLKVAAPEIPADNPFANDALGREEFATSLTSLVANVEDGLVLSLHAPWGEGKTTFVKMWQAALNKAAFPTIYFDAFAHDHLDDPFVGLAAELVDALKLPEGDEASLRQKASRAGAQLLTWGTKIAVRAATLGVINAADLDAIEGIKEEISKDVSDAASAYIEQRLASYRSDLKALADFRDLLERSASKGSKPIVFIVDELDRCKPTYAIEVLERIKHIFSVKGVAFVLVLNRDQLSESIRWVYGSGVDAQNYLQKFIDVECGLPKNVKRHESDYKKFCQHLYRAHAIKDWGDGRGIVNAMELFSDHFGLSLRAMQKVFSQVALFYASSQERQLRIPEVIVLLAIVRMLNRDLYRRIADGDVVFGDIRNDASINALLTKTEWLERCLKFFSVPDSELSTAMSPEDLRGFSSEYLARYGINRADVLPFFCARLERFRQAAS